MDDHAYQPGDAFASSSVRACGPAAGSRSEEAAPRAGGKHRLARSSRRQAAGFRPFRGIAVIVSAAAVAAAALAVSTHHGPAPSPARAQAAISAPQLTRADVQQLEHMTPAQTARFAKDLDTAYGKLGVHIGIGPSGTATLPDGVTQSAEAGKAILTSYQWAAGVQWDHVWVIASYANLQPIANNSSAIVNTAVAFCPSLPKAWAIACSAVGAVIAAFLGKVHVTNWSNNHGIWGAYYWLPWTYKTGGFW